MNLAASAKLPRIALEDVELPSGTTRAGEAVIVNYSALNHDPEVYKGPDELRLDFLPPHMPFGFGARSCLGNTLARMQLHKALKALVTRMPHLRIAPGDTEFCNGALARGLERLMAMR